MRFAATLEKSRVLIGFCTYWRYWSLMGNNLGGSLARARPPRKNLCFAGRVSNRFHSQQLARLSKFG
jgi:hypothetical protein